MKIYWLNKKFFTKQLFNIFDRFILFTLTSDLNLVPHYELFKNFNY